MKIRILLALCAIAIAVIAIGCSDGGRTTAPANTVEKLNIPNNNDANRFEEIAATGGGLTEPIGDYYIYRGSYHYDQSGCRSLEIAKNQYVEVAFVYLPPRDLHDGQFIEVGGRFSSLPGGHCQYSRTFRIETIRIIADTRGLGKNCLDDAQ